MKRVKKKAIKFTQQKWVLYTLVSISFLLILGTLVILFNPGLAPNSDIYEVSGEEEGIFANSNPSFDVLFGKKDDESTQWIRFESETKESNSFDPNYQEEKKSLIEKVSGIFKKDEKLGIEMSLSGVKLSETGNETIVDISDGELKVEDILGTDSVETSTELIQVGRILGEYDNEQNISKETIVNQNVWKGVDLEYQILEGIGIKEEIIIRSLESYMDSCGSGETDCEIPLNEFIFDLQLDEGVELHQSLVSVSGNPSGTYYFTDSKGNYLAHFLPCFAFDAGGNKTTGVTLDIEETDVENIYKIHVVLDIEWMLSAERIFPIHIDPSIVHDDSTDFDAGILNRLEDATGPKVQLVEQELTADEHTVGLWHMNETSESDSIKDSSGNGNDGERVKAATGGTITTSGVYTIHTFTSNGTFVAYSDLSTEVLVVAGGGGGGGNGGGGGGAGGVLYSSNFSINQGSFSVVVGAGGAANHDGNGGNSSFSTLTAIGGGAGANRDSGGGGHSGGSGGGGSGARYSGYDVPGSGTSGQGNSGGYGTPADYTTSAAGGGGGGASAVGSAASSQHGGNGGAGTAYSISGTTKYYGGGGGGGVTVNGTAGTGGAGGGGSNGSPNGVANTGGGGFGGSGCSGCSGQGSGGSGIVIIRYKIPSTNTIVTGKMGNGRYFNGSGDYIDIANSTDFDVSEVTIEAWVYSDNFDRNMFIFEKGSVNTQYSCFFEGTNLTFRTYNTSASADDLDIDSSDAGIKVNQWNHVACVYDRSTKKIYVNGIEKGSKSYTQILRTGQTGERIGAYGGAIPNYYFNGSIDEVRISNVARTPEEIKANAQKRPYGIYTSDIIDLTEDVTSIDDIQWIESGVNTGDGETPYSTTDLIGQWDFNETSGTVADNEGSCGASCDGTLTNMTTTGQDNGIGTGWTEVNSKWGNGAVMFDGSNDYVSLSDSSLLDFDTGDFTLEAWVNSTMVQNDYYPMIISKDGGTTRYGYDLVLMGSTSSGVDSPYFEIRNNGTGASVISGANIRDGLWHYLVAVKTSTQISIYVDGELKGSSNHSLGTLSNPYNLTFGAYAGNTSLHMFDGSIDSAHIYSRALSSSEILSNYNSTNIEFLTRTSADGNTWEEWKPSTDEIQIDSMDNQYLYDTSQSGLNIQVSNDDVIKQEGDRSEKIEVEAANQIVAEENLISFWHLEETSGSILDSVDSNNATPTGTTSVSGFLGRARSFDGASDYINIGDKANLETSNITLNFWAKTDDYTRSLNGGIAKGFIFGSGSEYSYYLNFHAGNAIGGITNSSNTKYLASISIGDNNWHMWTLTFDGSNVKLYKDALTSATTAAATSIDYTKNNNNFCIGARSTADYSFDGTMDEISFYNRALTSDEIYDMYTLGRGKEAHLSRGFSSTDLSSLSKLQYCIASDRPGTYLESIIGESEYVNNMPDSNTVGYWRLEEEYGNGAYMKDSSSYSNDGTPTGTTVANGLIGKARSFNGTSSDYIATGANYNFGASAFTVSLWVNPVSLANNPIPLSNGVYNTGGFYIQFNTAGQVFFYTSQSGAVQITSSTAEILTNKWQLLTITRSGSSVRIYVNGQDITSFAGTHVNPTSTTSVFTLGTYASSPSGYPFSGLLDEVRISNVARTATEIRQSYEMGSRTHPITIDFGASLNSGNLITNSSDTSFTIDATTKGLSEMGSSIYEGEKLIVKENYNGTEYTAQGTVSSVDTDTGAVTLSSWDTGSTFPSVGYSVNADVFKWQKEYIDLSNLRNDDIDAIDNITFKVLDGNEGRNIWIDDISASTYLSDPNGTANVSSALNRYIQYMAVITTSDTDVTPYLSNVTINYTANTGPSMDQVMRHGKWFNSSGQKQNFWWVD